MLLSSFKHVTYSCTLHNAANYLSSNVILMVQEKSFWTVYIPFTLYCYIAVFSFYCTAVPCTLFNAANYLSFSIILMVQT